jgi:pimeloyl-ACP methyl ester carboxylesterase
MTDLSVVRKFVCMLKNTTLLIILIFSGTSVLNAQALPGFAASGSFDEQQMVIENSPPGTRILINAPIRGFEKNSRVLLIFYALPNGNSIEQTFGRNIKEGDDWHFNIQHIGAQTRFLRNTIKDRTVVVAYFENSKKSWPAWNAGAADSRELVRKMTDDVLTLFKIWQPEIVLNGHSGGGSFILRYISAEGEIPGDVVRIAFLDSDYSYEDTVHGPKLTRWLKSGRDKYLCTLAYNDSVVIYNGKPLVSPTGGTWYRSRLMKDYLGRSFRLKEKERDSLIWYTSPGRRIEFIFKPNPEGIIYHTFQVEYNGFIHSILIGTRYEQKNYRYFGERAYSQFISDTLALPVRRMNIPARDPAAETGTDFMERISELSLSDREEEIYKAVASGNIPGFLRETVTLHGVFEDLTGSKHSVQYEVMPDYLAVGSDDNYCRVPMNPRTAQRLATLFGASLVTSVLSDHIYSQAVLKLAPFNYVPVGNANELVSKFVEHNAQIEKQFSDAGGKHGQLVAGIKKDIILSLRITEKHDRVVLYGWHKPGGKPIQPVYSGHVWWYVDYSHGIRFINNQVILDGRPALVTDILKDPVLFRVLSDEETPLTEPFYYVENDLIEK